MVHLAAVILTYNEAYHIAACVRSLRAEVDTVIVWDSGSTDETVALAQGAGALVVQRPFDNYAGQRQAALDAVAAEWILFIDADERVTPALMQEIYAATAQREMAGYWIARRNWIVGSQPSSALAFAMFG